LLPTGATVLPSASAAATSVAYDPATGQAIVSMAETIAARQNPWPNGCTPKDSVHCVPYSWGAGHQPTPGPSVGKCDATYTGHLPCVAKTLFGPDCSGFTRWVYSLVYHKDVLGTVHTAGQKTRPQMVKVPAGGQKPGELVFFPGHVGSNGVDSSHRRRSSHVLSAFATCAGIADMGGQTSR
jgi:cell wall-associated NlpC family hydrolase